MPRWITFSNGRKACQVGDYARTLSESKALNLPTIMYGAHEYVEQSKMTPQQKSQYDELCAKIDREAVDGYIEQNWPGQGVTVKEVQSLPYAANPQFGVDRSPNFCYTPEQCAGRSSCPKSRSCVD